MAEYTLSERLRYAFDNTMSKGVVALIAWLALLTSLLILSGALAVRRRGRLPILQTHSHACPSRSRP